MLHQKYFFTELHSTHQNYEFTKHTCTFNDVFAYGYEIDYVHNFEMYIERTFIAYFNKNYPQYKITDTDFKSHFMTYEITIYSTYENGFELTPKRQAITVYKILADEFIHCIKHILYGGGNYDYLLNYLFCNFNFNKFDENEFETIIQNLPNTFISYRKIQNAFIVECSNGYTYYKKF